jgi:hypothetical protein
MIVHIVNRVFEMNKEQADEILNIGKEQVPLGVYAVERDNVLVMCNDKANSKTQLKKMIREYKAKGFKVYSNGL